MVPVPVICDRGDFNPTEIPCRGRLAPARCGYLRRVGRANARPTFGGHARPTTSRRQKGSLAFARPTLRKHAMNIALTGASGFLGRYVVERLAADGHTLRCWYRPSSDRGGFEDVADRIEWVEGMLRDPAAAGRLVQGCDAVVHAALHRP